MHDENAYKRVRASTWLDFLICVSFAVPGISDLMLQVISSISTSLGGTAIPVPLGVGAFFVNLAGLFGVLWNIAMLGTDREPLHKVDLVARIGVVVLIGSHLASGNVPVVFTAFVVTEMLGGALKLHWIQSRRGY